MNLEVTPLRLRLLLGWHLLKLDFCALSKRLHACDSPVLQIELPKVEQLNEMWVQFPLCLILVGVCAIGPAKLALI